MLSVNNVYIAYTRPTSGTRRYNNVVGSVARFCRTTRRVFRATAFFDIRNKSSDLGSTSDTHGEITRKYIYIYCTQFY